MNDVFIMVIAIVAISVGAGIYRDYLKTQRQIGKNTDADIDLRDELSRLQARVAVLEEIVTDGKYELNRELEKL